MCHRYQKPIYFFRIFLRITCTNIEMEASHTKSYKPANYLENRFTSFYRGSIANAINCNVFV